MGEILFPKELEDIMYDVKLKAAIEKDPIKSMQLYFIMKTDPFGMMEKVSNDFRKYDFRRFSPTQMLKLLDSLLNVSTTMIEIMEELDKEENSKN